MHGYPLITQPIFGPGGIQPMQQLPWVRYAAAREQCEFGAPFQCSANQWAYVNSLDPIRSNSGGSGVGPFPAMPVLPVGPVMPVGPWIPAPNPMPGPYRPVF
jgi:hypothetical protein